MDGREALVRVQPPWFLLVFVSLVAALGCAAFAWRASGWL
jgi:hypothetical protein